MWPGQVRLIPINIDQLKIFGLFISKNAGRIFHITGMVTPLSALKKVHREAIGYYPPLNVSDSNSESSPSFLPETGGSVFWKVPFWDLQMENRNQTASARNHIY